MAKDITNWKVTKSNDLIKAGYTLSLNEQRLILLCIAQIDSRKPVARIRSITATEFSRAYPVQLPHAYEALEDAVDRLWEREVKTVKPNGRIEKIRWVSKATYDVGSGRVIINFSPEIVPFLTLLNERFTSYDLRNVAQLTSVYAVRIYEYLKQYVKLRKEIRIELSTFKDMLELSESYARFSNFKARVLIPAMEQINEFTDLSVTWEPVKEKRTVIALDFYFSKEEQQSLPLFPEEEPQPKPARKRSSKAKAA